MKTKRNSCIALGLLLALASTAAAPGPATEFDPSLRAPPPASAAQLEQALVRYLADFNRKPDDIAARVRNRALHAQWVDLWWALRYTNADLNALSAYGFEPGATPRTWNLDVKRFPELMPRIYGLHIYFNRGSIDGMLKVLAERGFRPGDIAAVREYVARNDPETRRDAAARTLAASMQERVQERAGAAQETDDAELFSFMYQVDRVHEEAIRAWTEGLLAPLDRERQAILANAVEEGPSYTVLGVQEAAETAQAVEALRRAFLSGEALRSLDRGAAEAGASR